MALTSTTLQHPVESASTPGTNGNEAAAPLLAALVISLYAAQKTKKELRKLKRNAVLTLFKYQMNATFSRVKSLFSKNPAPQISNRTLLYILLGLAVLILLFISWPAAVVLLLLGILLVLLTK
jgi:membrane-bound ClpP family serine protease